MKLTSPALLLVLLTTSPLAFAQPTGNLYIVEKGHDYNQIAVNTTVDGGFPNPWLFSSTIEGGTGLSVSFPTPPNTITPPGGSAQALAFNGNKWRYGEFSFLTQGALDAAYPNGNFTFNAGGNSIDVPLIGDLYPDIPLASVSAGTWVGGVLLVAPGQDLTITSNAFGSLFLANLAHMGMSIDKTSGSGIYNGQSEDLFPTSSGDTLQLTILAADLFPNSTYQVEMGFDRLIDPQNFNGGTGNAFGVYGSITNFQIQTVPEPAAVTLLFGAFSVGLLIMRRRWVSSPSSCSKR